MERGNAQQKGGGGRRAVSTEGMAFLELLQTGDFLTRRVVEVLKTADLSPTQFNVLRILRGAQAPLTCGEIAGRLITRDPDTTRLLDRLEKRGLIARSREGREGKDRRIVLTHISAEGLALLATLDGPVRECHQKQLGHLGAERLRQLRELLSAARGESR